MKSRNIKSIAGVVAPAPRPTPLGAAVFATVITFPIGMTLLMVNLLLF
jgi:hypothetical protein